MSAIVFATAEHAPLATTGGLGEVSAALPRELVRLGHRVSVFLPFYRSVRERTLDRTLAAQVSVPGFGSGFPVHLLGSKAGEPTLYVIEHQGFFDREALYGDSFGDYHDSLERFAFFSRAVLEATLALDLPVDVFHGNDWHTGLLGAYLRTIYAGVGRLRAAAFLFTIHNVAYQGRFGGDRLAVTGLPPDVFQPRWLEYYGQLNCLKAGMVFADAVTTVSPSYAAEIMTPEYGEGLDGVLRSRSRSVHGILNGIDTARWNPGTDPLIAAPYDAANPTGKARCREALIGELGLSVPPGTALVAMVSRLSWQKGCDIALGVASEILRVGSPEGAGAALVVLGAGDAGLERGFSDFAARHPGRVAVRIGFDDALAHRIQAGADLLLMPSRYEPCGLGQMCALRYGTVPVVRACGGLNDTVRDAGWGESAANGFKFREANAHALLEGLARALDAYRSPERWRALMLQGMAEDFSWQRSARRYEELYAAVRGQT